MAKSQRVLTTGLVVAGLVGLMAYTAGADQISPKVQRTFRGRLIVTSGALGTGGQSVADAIKTIKAAHKTELKAFKRDGGVSYYTFHWTAFMYRKPGVSSLSLEFYKQEGRNKFASGMSANKGLSGVSPSVTVLSGNTEISEDDGLNAGKTYKVKLVATVGSKDVLLAQTLLTFK